VPKAAAAKPRKPRKPKAAPASVGLTPGECIGAPAGEAAALGKKIEAAGGALLATYREPLGGAWLAFAALPLEAVEPTPFQRDLSEAHAKRLAESIAKLGSYLDPVIAVPVGEKFQTPNGRHRLEAMRRSGARTIMALVLPDPTIQYKILALNVEKAHNLREKSLEVIRMYRGMPPDATEIDHAFEFEEPALVTLGICYEHNGRFGGGAYAPILRRVDGFLDQPLGKAIAVREGRAAQVERLDAVVAARVAELKKRGMESPYLKAFVIARANPLRFMKTMPPFDEALETIRTKAENMKIERVKAEDLAATGGPVDEAE
jgi:ParB family transcriptional regulator, chromosome partitioning protein